METLHQHDEPMVLFSVGDFAATKKVTAQALLHRLVVERQLDPQLFELNSQGALNGHIPISGIIAFVLAVSAVLYDFDTAVMSNERSADSPNLTWHGQRINHQYSKSSQFELDAREQFARILPEFRYFSLLRPYSELHVTSLFAKYFAYHPLFNSCNAAFRLNAEQDDRRWCLDCPKCRFVFLALAPFLSKVQLLKIFGTNMFDDPSQIEGFCELVGLEGRDKPFECVGEIEESTAAFGCLGQQPEWEDDLVVRHVNTQLNLKPGEWIGILDRVLEEGSKENIPEEFRNFLPPPNSVKDTIVSRTRITARQRRDRRQAKVAV